MRDLSQSGNAAPSGAAAAAASAPAPAQPVFGAQPDPNQQPVHTTGWNFAEWSSKMGISRSGGSAALTAASSVFNEMLKGMQMPQTLDVLTLQVDMAVQSAVQISAYVLIAYAKGTNGRSNVFFYPIGIEATCENLTPIDQNYMGAKVEILRTAQDFLNAEFGKVVEQLVAGNCPNATKIQGLPGCVLYKTVPVNKDEPILRNLLNNALIALSTEILQVQAGYTPFSLLGATGPGLRLRSYISYTRNDEQDFAGAPVYQTISNRLTLTMSRNGLLPGQSQSEAERTLITSGGFIDLLWNPAQPQMLGLPGQIQQAPTQKFSPMYIGTRLDATAPVTLEIQLMAVLQQTVINAPHQWLPSFAKQLSAPVNGAIDPDDIGILNVETGVVPDNPGATPANPLAGALALADVFHRPVNTREATFGIQHLYMFLQAAIRPELFYALDVSVAGPDTCYNGTFAEAARGDKRAAAAILRAAETLFGPAFRKYYTTQNNPMVEQDIRVHAGYYEDANGKRRDLRSLGYIQVMNILGRGRGDNAMGGRWMNTFYDTRTAPEVRLAARKQIISAMVNGELVFNGWYQRCVFTTAFITACMNAAADCQFSAQTINPSISGDAFQNRIIADFAALTTGVMPGNAALFHQAAFGQFGQVNQWVGSPAPMGRYS